MKKLYSMEEIAAVFLQYLVKPCDFVATKRNLSILKSEVADFMGGFSDPVKMRKNARREWSKGGVRFATSGRLLTISTRLKVMQ